MSTDMYRTLTALAGNTATDVLEGAWDILDGCTAGGWAWTRQDDGGATVAVIGTKAFGLWTRVIWLCGKTGVSTAPGFLNLSTATSGRVYLGVGKILTADYAFAGWLDAAPIGTGGVGAVHALVDPGATTAVDIEAWVCDLAAAFRVEGSASTTARIGIAGALAKPIPEANRPATAPTADADGRYTGIHVLGTGTVAATFTTANPGATAGTFGGHGVANNNAHFGIFDGSTYTPVNARCPGSLAPPPGVALLLNERIHLRRVSDSQPVALLCNITGNVTTNVAGAAPGGVYTVGYVRYNSGGSGEALMLAAVEQWTT